MPTYIFKSKEGKELGQAEAATVFLASEACGLKEYYQVEEVKEFTEDLSATEIKAISTELKKKSRKPRADKGHVHKSAPKSPDKPKRNRGLYHLVKGEILSFGTKEVLDKYLSENGFTGQDMAVIVGGKVCKIECQKHFILSK